MIASILKNIMGVIRVGDPVLELIVLSSYSTLLQPSPDLYYVCREKLKEEFYLNKDKNQHATFICFNLLSALLGK